MYGEHTINRLQRQSIIKYPCYLTRSHETKGGTAFSVLRPHNQGTYLQNLVRTAIGDYPLGTPNQCDKLTQAIAVKQHDDSGVYGTSAYHLADQSHVGKSVGRDNIQKEINSSGHTRRPDNCRTESPKIGPEW